MGHKDSFEVLLTPCEERRLGTNQLELCLSDAWNNVDWEHAV